MSAPVTNLHYAPNANVSGGSYAPGADGFNLADVSSAAAADALPAGVLGLVYLGATDGVDASFAGAVQPAVGDAKVYGFYLADEPGPGVSAANLKAESDYVHAVDPGAKTFIVLENDGTPTSPSYAFTPANTDIDLFGLDPYPVRPQFSGGADFAVIGDAVAAAEAAGIPQAAIVPVYQAFGATSGPYASWALPTAAQEQTILSTWGLYTPAPAFDYAYSWGTQDGDTAISDDPALQAVFAAHNAGTPPPPADVLTPHAASISATAGQAFAGTVATFTDSNTTIAAGGLTATIVWGDGTPASAGVVSGGGGSFAVAGSHTYARTGFDAVSVTLRENPPAAATATADSTANVSPPPPPGGATMTATDRTGLTGTVPVIASGTAQTDIGQGVVSQAAAAGMDTVSFTNIASEQVQFGAGTVRLKFLSPGALTATGGTGTDTLIATSGNNRITAGTGSLNVAGGAGDTAFVFHAGDGLLIIEGFSASRDSLTVDKSLQGALRDASDGHTGTLLSFGTAGHGIDLAGVPAFAASQIHFA